eukprot:31518-Pelagococcus_subviridis.AAC.10
MDYVCLRTFRPSSLVRNHRHPSSINQSSSVGQRVDRTAPPSSSFAPRSFLVHPRLGRDVFHLVVQRLRVHGAVVDLDFPLLVHEPERVLHPTHVVAIREILPRVRASRLLALLRAVHRDLRVRHQVVQLERLDQVRVPHQRFVRDVEVLQP